MDCEICGERIPLDRWGFPRGEVGEFVLADGSDNVIAHAQCGLNAGLELA